MSSATEPHASHNVQFFLPRLPHSLSGFPCTFSTTRRKPHMQAPSPFNLLHRPTNPIHIIGCLQPPMINLLTPALMLRGWHWTEQERQQAMAMPNNSLGHSSWLLSSAGTIRHWSIFSRPQNTGPNFTIACFYTRELAIALLISCN
jgi:hypothetical protein